MGGSGATVVDFGPFPGQSDVVVTITGQAGIVVGSEVEAWIEPLATAAGFTADGYPFDGTRYLTRGANLSGAADSNVGIISCWVWDDGSPIAVPSQCVFAVDDGTNGIFTMTRDGTAATTIATILLAAATASGLTIFTEHIQQVPRRGWYHFLSSWDNTNNLGGVWIDDVQRLVFNRTRTNAVPFTAAIDCRLGAAIAGGGQWRAAIADLYFQSASFMDFTVQANRRKFNQIAGDGSVLPIDLGATGTGPTGTQPLVYMHMDHGADPATFITNKGSGGAFTLGAGSAPIAGQAIPLCIAPGHSADEHALETIGATADKSSIIAGAGFNIRVFNTSQLNEPLLVGAAGFPPVGGRGTRLCGKYNVGWAWN